MFQLDALIGNDARETEVQVLFFLLSSGFIMRLDFTSFVHVFLMDLDFGLPSSSFFCFTCFASKIWFRIFGT